MADEEDKNKQLSRGLGYESRTEAKQDEAEAKKKKKDREEAERTKARVEVLLQQLKDPHLSPLLRAQLEAEITGLIAQIQGIIDVGTLTSALQTIKQQNEPEQKDVTGVDLGHEHKSLEAINNELDFHYKQNAKLDEIIEQAKKENNDLRKRREQIETNPNLSPEEKKKSFADVDRKMEANHAKIDGAYKQKAIVGSHITRLERSRKLAMQQQQVVAHGQQLAAHRQQVTAHKQQLAAQEKQIAIQEKQVAVQKEQVAIQKVKTVEQKEYKIQSDITDGKSEAKQVKAEAKIEHTKVITEDEKSKAKVEKHASIEDARESVLTEHKNLKQHATIREIKTDIDKSELEKIRAALKEAQSIDTGVSLAPKSDIVRPQVEQLQSTPVQPSMPEPQVLPVSATESTVAHTEEFTPSTPKKISRFASKKAPTPESDKATHSPNSVPTSGELAEKSEQSLQPSPAKITRFAKRLKPGEQFIPPTTPSVDKAKEQSKDKGGTEGGYGIGG